MHENGTLTDLVNNFDEAENKAKFYEQKCIENEQKLHEFKEIFLSFF
mgnify:CR=1 FL=1